MASHIAPPRKQAAPLCGSRCLTGDVCALRGRILLPVDESQQSLKPLVAGRGRVDCGGEASLLPTCALVARLANGRRRGRGGRDVAVSDLPTRSMTATGSLEADRVVNRVPSCPIPEDLLTMLAKSPANSSRKSGSPPGLRRRLPALSRTTTSLRHFEAVERISSPVGVIRSPNSALSRAMRNGHRRYAGRRHLKGSNEPGLLPPRGHCRNGLKPNSLADKTREW